MRWTDILSIGTGMAIGLFGWIMIAGSVISTEDLGSPVETAALVMLLGIVPVILGFYLVWAPLRRRKRRLHEAMERRLLDLAEASGGMVLPANVARATDLTLAESRALLDEMVVQGYCQSDLEGGQVVYYFQPPTISGDEG